MPSPLPLLYPRVIPIVGFIRHLSASCFPRVWGLGYLLKAFPSAIWTTIAVQDFGPCYRSLGGVFPTRNLPWALFLIIMCAPNIFAFFHFFRRVWCKACAHTWSLVLLVMYVSVLCMWDFLYPMVFSSNHFSWIACSNNSFSIVLSRILCHVPIKAPLRVCGAV